MVGPDVRQRLLVVLILVCVCGLSVAFPVSAGEQPRGSESIKTGVGLAQTGSAEFTVQAVSKADVVQGDTFDARMKVTNTGDETGTRTLTFDVGSIHRETEMRLSPGETDTWYLTVDSDPLSAGEYTQYFRTPSDTDDLPLTVKAGEPNFLVGNLRVEQNGETVSRIDKGESAEIKYALYNDGEGRDGQFANCYLASSHVGDQFIELEPSESETDLSCSFDTDDLSPGRYEYGVESDDDSWYKDLYIDKPPQPPTITSAYPSGDVKLNHETGDSETFSVDVSDPDSDYDAISTEWSVDGVGRGTADELTVSADDLSPGMHTVRATVDDNQAETESVSREWSVRVVVPPKIDGKAPQQPSVNVAPGESASFDVEVDDADTPDSNIDVWWEVDGDRAGSGQSFEIDRSALGSGKHTVSVTVSDGTSLTDNARAEWTIKGLSKPQIHSISPSRSSVAPGEPVSFSVDASDPNGKGIATVQWELAGQQFSGTTVEHTFQQVGTVDVEVSVTNEAGITTTKSREVSIEATPPNVQGAGPTQSVVAVGESLQVSANATDPKGRSLSFDYRWELGTEEVSEQQSTAMSFDEVGQHKLTLTVTNSYGAKTTRMYTVRVRNDRPSVDRQQPTDKSISVLSQNPVRFAARVTNRDTSTTTVAFRIGESTVETRNVDSDRQRVAFQHTFDTPGEKTVTLVARDQHGAENEVTWDVNIQSRPPRFIDVSPSQQRLSLMSGSTTSFSVDARDPEQEGVTYQWSQNGSTVGTGPSLERTFDEAGTYNLTVEAADPRESASTRSWSVDVDSFSEPPTQSLHLTNIKIDPQSERTTKTFLTVSMENPSSNDRTVVVDFIIDTPDGLDVVRMRGVDAANKAQITGKGRIDPGSQRSMRVGLRIADESLIGSDVPIDVTIRYYPAGHPEDLTYIRQSNERISIRGPSFIEQLSSWFDGVLGGVFGSVTVPDA
ncbi:PKD domain-containing protein [Halobellus sp. Atlit-38R]|nr:PKD domain-containing protein [Halobellus sp. Atlit-38R]